MYDKRAPAHTCQKSPLTSQKSPSKWQKRPTTCQKRPTTCVCKESRELHHAHATAPPYKSKESKEPLHTCQQHPLPSQKNQKSPFLHVNSAPFQVKSIKRAPSYMSMPKKPEYKCVKSPKSCVLYHKRALTHITQKRAPPCKSKETYHTCKKIIIVASTAAQNTWGGGPRQRSLSRTSTPQTQTHTHTHTHPHHTHIIHNHTRRREHTSSHMRYICVVMCHM